MVGFPAPPRFFVRIGLALAVAGSYHHGIRFGQARQVWSGWTPGPGGRRMFRSLPAATEQVRAHTSTLEFLRLAILSSTISCSCLR